MNDAYVLFTGNAGLSNRAVLSGLQRSGMFATLNELGGHVDVRTPHGSAGVRVEVFGGASFAPALERLSRSQGVLAVPDGAASLAFVTWRQDVLEDHPGFVERVLEAITLADRPTQR